MSKGIGEYKVGDELFRYVTCAGVFRYVVTGRRERAEEIQLEVECKTCSHGWQCQLLLAQDDYSRIVAVHMLNNDDDDDQRVWHGNEGLHFWPTPTEAKNEQLRKLVSEARDRISKTEDLLKTQRARLDELKGLIEDVQP